MTESTEIRQRHTTKTTTTTDDTTTTTNTNHRDDVTRCVASGLYVLPGWTGYLGARVDDGERRGDDEYPGSTVAEHECRGEYLERAEQPDANVERYDAVDGVDVFRQAINDAARWRRVVEGDGQTQHVGQTARVQ